MRAIRRNVHGLCHTRQERMACLRHLRLKGVVCFTCSSTRIPGQAHAHQTKVGLPFDSKASFFMDDHPMLRPQILRWRSHRPQLV